MKKNCKSKLLIFNIVYIVLSISIIFLTIQIFFFRIKPARYTDSVDLNENTSLLQEYKSRLESNESKQMQILFPEGEFFSYALYGYSWINIGIQTKNESTKNLAVEEAKWTLEKLNSEKVQKIFDHSGMSINLGLFYKGWYNRLQAGIVLLEDGKDKNLLKNLESTSDEIAQTFRTSNGPFLEAYPRMIWPCDSITAISSLTLANNYLDDKYNTDINQWKDRVNGYMAKHDIDLLPHTINFKTGQPKEHARATSSSYILMFLSDIDKEWANYYYNNYMSTFKRSFLGFNLIREYPGDRDGKIDVDTGPIIFGFAATPTVTTAGVSRINRDKEPFEKLITLQEFLGMRINDRYLLGTLLIFDGFNIWSKTAVNWNNDIDKSATQKSFWFIKPILYLIIGLITPIVTLNLALLLTKRKEI